MKNLVYLRRLTKTIFSLVGCGIFVSTSIGCQNYRLTVSSGFCTARSEIVLVDKGIVQPFFCISYLNFSFMTKTMKNASNAKHSNITSRATCESGKSEATLTLQVSNPYGIVCFTDLLQVLQKHFDVEKNAKNKAYAYITSNGLLNDFAMWSRENRSDDWHDTCLKNLELLRTKGQIYFVNKFLNAA